MEFDKIVKSVLEEELSREERIKALKNISDFKIGSRVIVNPGQRSFGKDRYYDIGGVMGTITGFRPAGSDIYTKTDQWFVKLDAGYMYHHGSTGLYFNAKDISLAE